jgi:hypothetical protein
MRNAKQICLMLAVQPTRLVRNLVLASAGSRSDTATQGTDLFTHFLGRLVVEIRNPGQIAERPVDARVGFYGLDLYSLHRSIDRVIEYLDKVDPTAAQRARHDPPPPE